MNMRRVGKRRCRRMLVERPRTPAPRMIIGLSVELGLVECVIVAALG